MVGVKPAVIQLNETATTFAALARLDEFPGKWHEFVRGDCLCVYANTRSTPTTHYSKPPNQSFYRSQFEKLTLPNTSRVMVVRCWLMEQFRNDCLRPNLLAIELTEAKNGVSKPRARGRFSIAITTKSSFTQASQTASTSKRGCCQRFCRRIGEREIIDKFGLLNG